MFKIHFLIHMALQMAIVVNVETELTVANTE